MNTSVHQERASHQNTRVMARTTVEITQMKTIAVSYFGSISIFKFVAGMALVAL